MKKIYLLIAFVLPLSLGSFAQQDTTHHYTDAEVIKLSGYIKTLEQKTSAYQAAHPNDVFVNNVANSAQERMILTTLVNDSLHRYNDAQVIKLAKYIKRLEKLDSLNTVEMAAIAAAKKRRDDSLALVATQVKGVEQFQSQINFDFNSAVIKKESFSALDEAVKVLKTHDGLHFVIEGHTDNVGTDEYNKNLSNSRAKAVMNYFVSKGIPSARISSMGYGEAKPIATNDTEEGRAKNRRVEIKATKK
jgi:outer membrane protein OmpA-like peptidoglycan-associated protein